MLKKIKKSFFKHYKYSIIKALIAAIFFLIIHLCSNIELVREHAEDFSFDTINKFFISEFQVETASPKVKLFAIDNKYLNENHLLDSSGEPNYGYVFPRDQIAVFIKRLDKHAKLLKENIPKVLFIDYDMSYKTTNYNKELSVEDKKLIEVLKEPRPYKIIFPKTNHQNIIEDSKDPKIIGLLKNKQITVASVGLTLSSDDINRRFYPYKEFDNKNYLNVVIEVFNLFNNTLIKTDELMQQNVIENRIVFRTYNQVPFNDKYNYYESNWSNLNKYSAHIPFDLIINEDFKDSIIFLGSSFEQHDIFSNNSIIGNQDFNGIDVHANALMTLFWLDGNLKKINLVVGIVLIFIIFFLCDMTIEMSFDILNLEKNKISEFIVLLILSGLVLIFISNYILTNHFLWFNWIIPFTIFQLIEIIELTKVKHIIKRILSKGVK